MNEKGRLSGAAQDFDPSAFVIQRRPEITGQQSSGGILRLADFRFESFLG
jgi:hypothetical protein